MTLTATQSDAEVAREALAKLAPWRADDREDCVRVGAALKTVGEEMFGAWDEWLKQSEKYEARWARTNWRSFKLGKVTLGTLIYMAKKDGNYSPAQHERYQKAKKRAPAPRNESTCDWSRLSADAESRVDESAVERLGNDLGLSPDSLKRLQIGRHSGDWVFPMRNWANEICGLRTRSDDGNKACVPGSVNGLFVPRGVAGGVSPLVIVEGPTDCAAVLDMGFDAIGRPNQTGGHDFLCWWISQHRRETREVVILIDRDKPDSDLAMTAARRCVDTHPDEVGDAMREFGLSAAEVGTVRAALKLARALCNQNRAVSIIAPPLGFKDARDWRGSGAGADDLDAAIEDGICFDARPAGWGERGRDRNGFDRC